MSRRIVSLLPAATEIVCALGAGARLVGRSHECDFPPEVRALPACTEGFTAGETSGEIHQQVMQRLESSAPLYCVNEALLRDLCPDLILTQAQCDVCAVSLHEVERIAAKMFHPPQILALAPQKLSDVWDDITRVGTALGLPDNGRDTLKRLKNRCVDIIMQTAAMTRRPAVACIEWFDPLMAAGNWVPELVEFAGGKNLFGEAGKHSPWMKWEELAARDPDVLVLMLCGFDLARTRRELPALTAKVEWPKLRTVKTNRVYLADGSQFFNRPGPRLVDSLEILAEILHPDLFKFGHRGTGWEPMNLED